MNAGDLSSLVKRIVGRVMAERGRSVHPAAHPVVPGGERVAGVFVTVDPGGEAVRPLDDEVPQKKSRQAELVAADSLAKVPNGGSFRVPAGAIVTDLAREEAWRRRIQLVTHLTSDDGRRRVAIGSDHGGFKLKKDVIEWVRLLGHEVFDLGTRDENAVDYPDFARAVAEAVASRNADLGIVIDGAGIGSTMAANKVPGVRAANCWCVDAAKNAREHNYANVLGLGAKLVPYAMAQEVVRAFLTTPEGEERHGRRVKKIGDIERHYSR